MTRAVIVFAKYPKIGTVKTRLAAGIGGQAATDLYKSFVSKILQESLKCTGTSVYLALAAPVEHQLLTEWLQMTADPSAFILMQQLATPDLGERMRNAMQHVIDTGATEVVLVGSDIPDLDAGILTEAFAALSSDEIVFGPAQDGGFYLVGARRLHRHLFQGITWSTSDVLVNTVKQAESCGLVVAVTNNLPRLRDIDTAEDLEAWLAQAKSTAACLDGMMRLAEESLRPRMERRLA
ncbi:hypothetical protein WJX84_003401 [Apatococcus fuscideae]|uniref:Glycosyltransferase n=1 Tax=Apatococcus fuscideae TaxID=2026836 RepID=A0AAW1SLN3_9CHLO